MHLSRRIKQTACAALASAVLLSGCSTPAVAATVDGKEYSTGVYLAYLYQIYTETYSNYLYMYAYYGMDPWEQTIPYGEGDDEQELPAEDYIIQLTKDTIVRQKALENKIAEYGLEPDPDELADVESQLAQVSGDDIIKLGFNKESYGKMLRAYALNERTLFYGLYDNGGERAMSEEDIRAYFDENYLSYKIIEISLTDSSGGDMDDEEVEEVRERLQGYLDMYEESGDFDSVIEQYNKDEDEDDDEDSDSTGTTTTTGGDNAATTTAAATTTTTGTEPDGTTTTTGSGEESGDGGEEEGEDEEEEETDPNLHNIDASAYDDEAFTDAIKSVPEGEAQIVEYKKNESTNTMALILRLDPEEANKPNEDGETYFEQNRENIIYGAKYEEFDDEITEYAKTLDVQFDEGVVRKCTPRQMEKDAGN